MGRNNYPKTSMNDTKQEQIKAFDKNPHETYSTKDIIDINVMAKQKMIFYMHLAICTAPRL